MTECAYSEPSRLGEDRRITGIYEAKDATWSLVRPAHLDPYTALVRRKLREELGRNRIQLSDGSVCYDWPTVVLDGEDGREIVAGSEHPEQLLPKIIEQRRPAVLAGQKKPKRWSPVLLWAVRA